MEFETLTRPKRWDRTFGDEEMRTEDVALVLEQPFLKDVDPSTFPKLTSLEDIIRHDARIVQYGPDDVIIRRGDYGNSLFAIIEGEVQVVTQPHRSATRRRRGFARRWSRSIAGMFGDRSRIERRNLELYRIQTESGRSQRAEFGRYRGLKDLVASGKTIPLGPGDVVGESAALTRQARSADVVASTAVKVVEIRWQGIRDIRQRAKSVRDFLNQRYRSVTLKNTLEQEEMFRGLRPEVIEEIAKSSLIETYGKEDWYRKLERNELGNRLGQEPIIVGEGHQLDDIIFILSGFGRITEPVDQGERTIGYVRAGEAHGLAELAQIETSGGSGLRQTTLRAIGTVNVLRIPTPLVTKHILPAVSGDQLRNKKAVHSGEDAQRRLDFVVDGRYMNGTASMLIDLKRCTGCDDCVRACSSTHNNNPRFIRHGHSEADLMVANACMHCVDPVCLIDCPTGAIRRIEGTRTVAIDDAACIGCATCANSCPYSNIRMVEIRNDVGQPVLDTNTNQPILKATKCDLCFESAGGPACQRACPHDALIRMDMQDVFSLLEWIER